MSSGMRTSCLRLWSDPDHPFTSPPNVASRHHRGHTRDMNTNKRTKTSNGFGLQKDITEEGAVIYLRITNHRRLDVKTLGEVLMKFFRGGYKTLVLDQGRNSRAKMNLVEFLGRLQATYNESRLFLLERKLFRDINVH